MSGIRRFGGHSGLSYSPLGGIDDNYVRLAPIRSVHHVIWPTQEAALGNATVYRFTVYDITSDGNIRSRRWGTREGIKAVCGVVMEDTGIEIDARFVGGEVEGLTERGFDPHPRTGFQTQVEPGLRPV